MSSLLQACHAPSLLQALRQLSSLFQAPRQLSMSSLLQACHAPSLLQALRGLSSLLQALRGLSSLLQAPRQSCHPRRSAPSPRVSSSGPSLSFFRFSTCLSWSVCSRNPACGPSVAVGMGAPIIEIETFLFVWFGCSLTRSPSPRWITKSHTGLLVSTNVTRSEMSLRRSMGWQKMPVTPGPMMRVRVSSSKRFNICRHGHGCCGSDIENAGPLSLLTVSTG